MSYIARVTGTSVVLIDRGTLEDVPPDDVANWRNVVEIGANTDVTGVPYVESIILDEPIVRMIYAVQPQNILIQKMELRKVARSHRRKVEIGGAVISGMRFDSSDESQSKVNSLIDTFDKGWTSLIDFQMPNGAFVPVDKSTADGIGQGLAAHVQQSFSAQKTVVEEIEAGAITTSEQVRGHSAWPSNA